MPTWRKIWAYSLQGNSASEYEDLRVGDVCSRSRKASEEEIHENRKRAYVASVNKEKILQTLEESQPRLSKGIVDSAPFPSQQGHTKTKQIPLRSPFSSSEKKSRMRMSLDHSASPLSFSLPGLPNLETGPLAISAITDGSNGEVVADVKSFEDTDKNVKPGTLKRVQSDAMLNEAEEASKAFRRSSDNDEYLEEVLTLVDLRSPIWVAAWCFLTYLTYKVLELKYLIVTKVCIHVE